MKKESENMEFTGERFVPEVHGNIELEHLHRYLLACKAVAGKTVLDIASGEGYGSAMLARTAHKVTGVDISQEAISHAQAKYQAENLEFRLGSCSAIPLGDASVDMVVSFETIEHHDEHEAMMREIKRVLRPGGVLVISSPDKLEYSDKPGYSNPHHVKELYRDEFKKLLDLYFKNHSIYGQRVVYGSMIFCEDGARPAESYELADGTLSATPGVSHAVYLVAIASDVEPPFLGSGVLEQHIEDTEITCFWRELMADRDGQIASLNQAVADRDGQIASLNQAVAERDGQIASLNQAAAERQAEYQSHVSELEKAVWAEQQRYSLQAAETNDLRHQIDRIISSRSWRVTAPLRKMMTFAHELPRGISGWSRDTYHALPISPAQRQKLKNFLFVVFGFAFVRMDAYKRWKEYRQIQTEWPSAELAAPTTPAASVVPWALPSLQTADGTWEWRDYDAVKSRISQIKAHQLSQVAPTPLDMIDIGNESFENASARVKLPALSAEPDVSIILPVFNNLKLTLECLLSISAHTDSRISYEIILADDASTDGTAQVVSKIENLRIIRNDQNLGFLRNCNKALEHVRGQYVVYLNNDVQVTRGWLTNLHETFTTQPNVGAAGSRFVYPSGHLQEAGVAFRHDGTADMVGLNDDSEKPRYSYTRRVDYISGACLMLPSGLARQLGGFSEDFLPCYCEDSDLCLRVQAAGYYVYYNPASTIIHHLSKTTAAFDADFKLKSISANLVKLQQKWIGHLDQVSTPQIIAFYLPQFHPFPENDHWWGNGFTEWTNVTKAQPNFVGHDQPRLPADLGFYDLRLPEVMQQQADLARRYGINGFCFYYYWFGGKRLLERPIEQMLATGKPDMPFCLCWANENWTRRWDGQDHEVLLGQSYSPEDDEAVINDLIRYFRDPRYIQIDGRPLILVYRVTLFPDFSATIARWRNICKDQGIGEIYVAMVESMELVHANKHPREFGCDAAVEFPPLEMAEQKPPSGQIINPKFAGTVADYRDLAIRYATREFPGYTRFKGVMPGWDNTARRQNNSFCFEHATPGAFQAWLEETIEQTRQQHYGDERLVFVNAWNEWAEGAYLEPDRRFGHTYLEAVKNAIETARLLCRNKYWHGN